MQYTANETSDENGRRRGGRHDALREEEVRLALREDKGKEASLVSWTARGLTEAGDNFTAVVASVGVSFRLAGAAGRASYVAKLDPRRGPRWDDFIRLSFEKEVGFYERIAPEMSRALESAGLPRLRVPRCLLTSLRRKGELILQEDLRAQGFRLLDRAGTMDGPHALLALRELARLHAASLLARGDDATAGGGGRGFLSRHWSNFKPGAEEGYRSVMADALQNAGVVLERVGGFGRALEWMDRIRPRVLRVFQEQTAASGPFAAVCHFDVVSNNFLFRYDKNGEPTEIRLLDFQMCYNASLATDLTEFFLTCLSGADRKRHFESLLRSYYTSYSQVLEAGGAAVPFGFESLLEEYRARLTYGALSAICKIPYILAQGKEIPDMDEYLDQEAFSSTQLKSLLVMQEEYEGFGRFLSIFDDLDRFGLLD